jgi:hypothetical protein
MTRRSSATLAGAMYLLYIALALPAMILAGKAKAGDGTAAKLASIAAHAAEMHITILLDVFTAFVAIALAVGLYGVTRDEDHELAVLAMCCRVGEGLINAIAGVGGLALLRLATASGADAPDAAGAQAVGAYLLKQNWSTIGAILFAWGSSIFSWLLLRGRMIPIGLAWLGVLASLLLVVCLPLQMVGILSGTFTGLMWIPMALFEIPLGFWLIIKGVAPLRPTSTTP